MTRSCGSCTLCCTVMKVTPPAPAAQKPAHSTCVHCSADGCGIYEDRPTVCREFMCWWLGSQLVRELRMPSAMRPDRTGIVLDFNSAGTVMAHCERPDAWKREPMHGWLLQMAAKTNVILESSIGALLLRASGVTIRLMSIGVDPDTNCRLYVPEREVSSDAL